MKDVRPLKTDLSGTMARSMLDADRRDKVGGRDDTMFAIATGAGGAIRRCAVSGYLVARHTFTENA